MRLLLRACCVFAEGKERSRGKRWLTAVRGRRHGRGEAELTSGRRRIGADGEQVAAVTGGKRGDGAVASAVLWPRCLQRTGSPHLPGSIPAKKIPRRRPRRPHPHLQLPTMWQLLRFRSFRKQERAEGKLGKKKDGGGWGGGERTRAPQGARASLIAGGRGAGRGDVEGSPPQGLTCSLAVSPYGEEAQGEASWAVLPLGVVGGPKGLPPPSSFLFPILFLFFL